MGQGVGVTAFVVEKVQGVATGGLSHQFATGIEVVVGHTVKHLLRADTVLVIGVGIDISISLGSLVVTGFCRNQVPALFPGEVPPGAIIVAGGIAGAIVRDGLPVKGEQKVFPHIFISTIAVEVVKAILIGMAGSSVGGGEDITYAIIGIGVGLTAAGLAEQLILSIVGIGVGGAVFCVSGDVPSLIVGIAVDDVGGKIVGQPGYLLGGLGGADIPVGVDAVQ